MRSACPSAPTAPYCHYTADFSPLTSHHSSLLKPPTSFPFPSPSHLHHPFCLCCVWIVAVFFNNGSRSQSSRRHDRFHWIAFSPSASSFLPLIPSGQNGCFSASLGTLRLLSFLTCSFLAFNPAPAPAPTLTPALHGTSASTCISTFNLRTTFFSQRLVPSLPRQIPLCLCLCICLSPPSTLSSARSLRLIQLRLV